MDRVFVCSPLRGSIEENIKKAKEYCKFVAQKGKAPFAPHVFCSQFLDDNNESERNIGIEIGLSYLEKCDELWIFCPRGQETEGMKYEIEFAKMAHVITKYVTL